MPGAGAIGGLGARVSVTGAGFVDVSDSSVHFPGIKALSDLRVFDGTACGPDRFCPGDPLPRWMMAVWLVRVLDGADPSATTSRFADVTGSPWWEPHVERLAELGVTVGCDTNRFCPFENVSRAQMATFLDRAFGLPPATDAGFADVSSTGTHYASINAVAASNITKGCGRDPLVYCPRSDTTRAQMATFLWRALPSSADTEVFFDEPLEPEPLYDAGQEAAPTTLNLKVHYCGPTSDYDLNAQVDDFNSVLSSFFSRQSNGRTTITFETGKVVSPATINNTNFWDWGRVEVNACLEDAGDEDNTQAIILADVPNKRTEDGITKGRSGYAWPRGPAVAASIEKRSGNVVNYLGTIAHEIGHAFFLGSEGLNHPWRDHPQLCLSIDRTPKTTSLSPKDQQFCNVNAKDQGLTSETITEMLKSLMSYVQFGSERDIRTGGQAYIACYQKDSLGWLLSGESCEFRASIPAIPHSPTLTPEVESMTVTWSASANNGSEIADYDVEYRASGTSTWISWPHEGVSRRTTIHNLTGGVAYQVHVRARNTVGVSKWSSYSEAVILAPDISNPRVLLSVGEPVGDGAYWLNVELEGFLPGEHVLACAHNGVLELGISRGVFSSLRTSDWPSTRACSLPAYRRDVEVFVIVDAEERDGVWSGGIYSNVVKWPTIVVPPPSANIVNDDPVLHDRRDPYSWFKPPEGIDVEGYGSNGFHVTLAIGNDDDDELDNWARWEFGSVSGRYEIQAWIPGEWATAHPQYLIWVDQNGDGTGSGDEFVAGPWLDQDSVSGWQTLGTYNLQGRVLIEVRDVRTRDDYRDHPGELGVVKARLAADAIQLIPVDGSTDSHVDIYDDPVLHDRRDPYSWFKPPEGIDVEGYGSNGFHVTLAIGNDDDDELDNWARWEFGSVSGRYEIQAWIPGEWATAHPQYLIWVDQNGDGTGSGDEFVAGPWLDQDSVSGWQTLGTYNLQGRVLIEVRDVRTRDDYRDHPGELGVVKARLAADAIRLRPVS